MAMNRLLTFLVLWLGANACSTVSRHPRHERGDPDERLRQVLQEMFDVQANGEHSMVDVSAERVIVDSGKVAKDLRQLALEFPDHNAILLANAIVAREQDDVMTAQIFLDRILARDRSDPRVATLRSQLALDEGNSPFAKKLLTEQLQITPADPGVHEALAGVLFVDGDYTGALRELSAAAKLVPEPTARLHYHRGLVTEWDGRLSDALVWYDLAVETDPNLLEAQRRAQALRARP